MVWRYLSLAACLGLLVGVVGSAFHWGADAALQAHVWASQGQPLWRELAISMSLSAAMLCGALYLTRQFAPEASGSGIPEVEAAIDGRFRLRWARLLPVKFFGGMLAIGSGAVVGREGPTIHIGAAIAEALAGFASLATNERRGLLSAGAAAGLGTAFGAPVASVLFVMEETRGEFPVSFHTFAGVITASAVAGIVASHVLGFGPILPVVVSATTPDFLVVAAVLGGVLGVLGVLFNHVLLAALTGLKAIPWLNPYLFAAAIGAALGALLVAHPDTVRGGEALIGTLVASQSAITFLVALCALRLALTICSYGIGVPGGLFAPLLALAVCLGLAFSGLVHALPLGHAAPAAATAVIAMAGFFAATVRAPMVGVVLVAELTGAFALLLPMLICAGVAHIVAHACGGQPIYTQLLQLRLGAPVRPRPDKT